LQLDEALEELQAELIVILDDVDLSLLTRSFLTRRMGRALVMHASLLPSFPGMNPVEAALQSGVCITGCTVSFAVPPASLGSGKLCFGPHILQEATRISVEDTATSLRQRIVDDCESPVLPRAVQLVACGSVALRRDDGGYGLGRSSSFCEASSNGMLGDSPAVAMR